MHTLPSRRHHAGKSLMTVLMLFLCLPFFTSCESRKTIVNQISEQQANEIIVFLASKGIDASKLPSAEAAGAGAGSRESLWDISVPSEQAIDAMSLLNQAGLPRRRGENLLNIFKESGLVPSEMTEQIRYRAGLAEQIASTIRKIDGVLDAEVQLSFPPQDPLHPGKSTGDITASVYVKHNGVLDDPNSHLITKIKRLVAASVPGLKYDNVTVIADRARYSSEFPVGLHTAEEEEKPFVKTWTLVIAKESLFRFRLIFFTFLIICLFLILAFIWIGWKISPLLKNHGGIGSLFSLTPLAEAPPEEKKKGEEEKEAAEGDEEGKKEDEDEGPPSDVT